MTFAMHADDRPNFVGARKEAFKLVESLTAPSVPVTEIAERNGVNVLFTEFGKHAEAVAGFIDFAAKRIFVNKVDSTTRQRFTVAHELGHWMLHRKAFEKNPELYPVLPRFQSGDRNNAFEQEANAFAAELLVPDHLLRQVRDLATVSKLADMFYVSRLMMENRLKHGR